MCAISLLLLLITFHNMFQRVGFQWSLSDCKSPQVFKNLLDILADFYNPLF